ncbi:unnamed protein product [Lactuca saligna]|uniref:Uncharacterized protein n=1 Tax=Lactuca saligna TaxID=75948 RepID=A0AA35YXK4_LACSI|nr:unnamed protein product [Lactuca saligna]
MFANECGVLTMSMISVEYMSWKKVPIAQEDMVWSTTKEIGEKARENSMHNNNHARVDFHTQISEGYLVLSPGEDLLTKEQRTKKQIPATSLLPTNARAGTNKNIPNKIASKARPIEYLRDGLKTNPVVNIVADSGILEVGTYDCLVTSEEYFRLLRKQTTNASILTAQQLILHSMFRTCMSKCAFLNPYNILGEACQKNPEGVVSYIVDSIRLHHGKLFLDTIFAKAFMRYDKDSSTLIGWIFAECNQQLGGLESGHYVMRWMVDFLTTRQHGFPSKCNQQLGGLESGHYVMRWMVDFLTTRQHGFPSKSGSILDDKSPFEKKALLVTVAS